jgi:hypothetical protein
MQIKRFILLAGALVALAVPSVASATTYRTETCLHKSGDGVTVEVFAMGRTSCALAMAGSRKVVRLGYAPRTLRVYSSVTHRSYTLRRDNVERDGDRYWSAVYVGANEISFQVRARA